jgi:predicted amidophosphoribosyltransferase
MFFIKVDVGNDVICDICNADYTDSEELGGILIGTYAICPECAKRFKEKPDDMPKSGETFCEFVRRIR